MFRLVTLILLTLAASVAQAAAEAVTAVDQKAVLVTGASSGLGRVMAETMAAKGYFVYAGARKDEDIEELNHIENIQAIRLDVNVPEQIEDAVKTIAQAGRGLYGLVNNAGVVVLKPLIEIDEEDFHFQMDVNVFGPYRVTRAFAPLIIESKGRISVIGSIAGTLSSATWGPYSMTKHAMEAYADALSDEMRKFGVHVSLIEPGTYKSKIAESALDRMEQRNQTMENSQFEAEMKDSINWLSAFEEDSGDPAEVAQVVMHALFDDTPKPRYLVVPNREQARWTINRAIERMVEQNADQEYSFDRETLIEMLDASLAKHRGATP